MTMNPDGMVPSLVARSFPPPLQRTDPAVCAVAAVAAAALAVALGPLALVALAALLCALVVVRYPPVLLMLFVYVSFFKSEPAIASLPFDPTLFLGVLLLAVCAYRLITGSARPMPLGFLLPLVLIAGVLLVGVTYTSTPGYGLEKAARFSTLTLLAAVAPFFVIRGRRDLILFLAALAAGAIVVSVLALIVPPTVAEGIASEADVQGRLSFGGQIFPARFLVTGALVLLFAPVVFRGSWRYAGPLLSVGVMLVALGFGARGPILALVATLVCLLGLVAVKDPRQVLAVTGVCALAVLALTFVQLPGQADQRLGTAATDPLGTLRSDGRSALFGQAIDLASAHPLTGIGTGGFAPYASLTSRQVLLYPHNIFLELASENGIFAPLLLLASLVGALVVLVRTALRVAARRDRQLLHLLAALLLLNLFAAQFSGDVNDNRTVWMFLGIAWLSGGPRLHDLT
jgi:O-antigen ligase